MRPCQPASLNACSRLVAAADDEQVAVPNSDRSFLGGELVAYRERLPDMQCGIYQRIGEALERNAGNGHAEREQRYIRVGLLRQSQLGIGQPDNIVGVNNLALDALVKSDPQQMDIAKCMINLVPVAPNSVICAGSHAIAV